MCNQARTDVYTALFRGREYPNHFEARKAAEEMFPAIVRWGAKCYDLCDYHGDSEIGLTADGVVLCEVKSLMNHSHCCAFREGKRCGYDEQETY